MPVNEVSIKGFVDTSFLDWPGRVVSVVFLPGCNLRCPFCHNRSLVLSPEKLEDFPVSEVFESLLSHKGWLDGVVVSGGEPTITPSLEGFLTDIKAQGLAVKLDTNGSRPGVIRRLIKLGLLDAVAMDIKAPLTGAAYEAAAGTPVDISGIKESIQILLEGGIEAIFRATVVPGLHDEDAVRKMAQALGGRRLILQDFRPEDALDPAYRLIRPFGPESLRRLQDAADEAVGG